MENIILDNIPANEGVSEEQNKIAYEKVLDLALKIGVGILSSGGSVSRVETAVDMICTAYGVEEVSCAAFPSMIIGSIKLKDGSDHSLLKRVYSTSNNLARLEKFNQLSRDICREKYAPDEALRMVFELNSSRHRNKWITIIGAGLVSACYSVFFGGTAADLIPAFIVAFIMAGINELISTRSLNAYATVFLLSLIGGLLSTSICKLCVLCGLICHGSVVIIGTIMILIPGLMLTNAVRDLFTGDIMSGTFQITNALLLTVVIAAGYGVALIILRSIADFVPVPIRGGWVHYVYFFVSGMAGTFGVCLFFNLNFKRLGWAFLATLITLGVYIGVDYLAKGQTFLIVFVTALFAAVFSEILARLIKSPATVFIIPSIIALVPGSSLYYTMEAIVQGDVAEAGSKGLTCVLIILGLAVGLCAATVLFRIISPVKLMFYKKNKAAFKRQRKKYEEQDIAEGKPVENAQPEKKQNVFVKTVAKVKEKFAILKKGAKRNKDNDSEE